MKRLLILTMACLSACSWLPSKRHAPSDPTEIVVTGAPAGSTVFIDGVSAGQPTVANDRPQILDVTPGAHTVEIHVDEKIVYREDTDVGRGERRVVTVLSGLTR